MAAQRQMPWFLIATVAAIALTPCTNAQPRVVSSGNMAANGWNHWVDGSVGCAAIMVPKTLVAGVDPSVTPITLAYSVTTTQMCTVPDPTRIQIISARYELEANNGYSMRLWCSGDAEATMTIEWIDFQPQYNSYGGRLVRFQAAKQWINTRVDIVPPRTGRYSVVLGFNTAPGRFYCDAFELFSVGPTNLPVDTSVRRYDDIDSIVDKPLTPSTPLRPWSLPRVTGAVTPPPPPPTVGLGTCSRMDNVVFMGNDMNDGCAVRRTADQCCQVCQATRNCKAWTSLKDNHPFCPGGCFLKFDVPSDIRAEATMLSGTIPGVPLPPRPGGSTPPPPIPQQTCTTRDGWDFFGNDMNDGCASGQRVESLAACCARCQATSGCRAFSYVKPTSPWCPGGCYLKRQAVASTLIQNAQIITGTPPGVPMPQNNPTCTLRDGWDLFGNDINNGCAADQRVASAELCCARCQATSGCRAFSFTKPTDARCPGACWLKRQATQTMVIENAIAIAGTVPGETFPGSDAPTSTPPPPPPAQTCTLRDGWDLFGNDINNGCAADQRVASAELCCERCQATNGCRAFSFTKTTDARCAGACWLKRDATPSMVIQNAVTIAGTVPGVGFPVATPVVPQPITPPPPPPPPPPPTSAGSCSVNEGWDLFGNDLNNGCDPSQRVSSAAACCARCQQTQGCRAFSFTMITDRTCPGACWLKNQAHAGMLINSALSVSGTVPGVPLPGPRNTPPPTTPPPPPPAGPAPPTAPGWAYATANIQLHNPLNNKQANCLTVDPGSIGGDKASRYWDWLAAVNDGGSLFGGGRCTRPGCAPDWPVCNNQQNCGRCYEVRCVNACQQFPGCASSCRDGQVAKVMVVDACAADSMAERRFEQRYGFNLCRAATAAGRNNFGLSPRALDTIRQGTSWELAIEYREVAC